MGLDVLVESKSAHAIKYIFTGNTNVPLSREKLIADTAPGPLQSLFQALSKDSDWADNKILKRPDFSVYITPLEGSAVALSVESNVDEGPRLEFKVAGQASLVAIIELRFHHSISR